MPYIFDIQEFENEDMSSFKELSLINLLDESDFLYKAAENIMVPPGNVYVVCHGTPNNFGVKIFDENGVFCDTILYTPKEVADKIAKSGKWHGETIHLIACYVGSTGVESAAQTIADQLGVLVYAPTDKVYLSESGKYYVSDNLLEAGHPDLRKSVQEKRWAEFLPITY